MRIVPFNHQQIKCESTPMGGIGLACANFGVRCLPPLLKTAGSVSNGTHRVMKNQVKPSHSNAYRESPSAAFLWTDRK